MCAGIVAFIDSARGISNFRNSLQGTRRLQRQSVFLHLSPIRDTTYQLYFIVLDRWTCCNSPQYVTSHQMRMNFCRKRTRSQLPEYELHLGFGFISHDDPEPDDDDSSAARVIAPGIGGDYKRARHCHGSRLSRKATETCRANGSRGSRELFDRCRSGGRLALPESIPIYEEIIRGHTNLDSSHIALLAFYIRG